MTTITADVRPDAADEPEATPDPRWARPGLLALLAGTAVLYLWGLGSSGWANSYYAAAAQAGTQSWKAWLFGSLDAGNAITVDKPPAAMWVMGLSGRLFGFNEFTLLLPQALMGVAAVAVLYLTVKRSSGPGAGLIAGAVLALTPVATLMFRYDNPDALLVLLLVVAAYCTVRAIENGSTRWMALTGCVVGFAFLTKMLQAFLIVPGLALAFLVAAPIGLSKRIGALLVGGVTMVVSAGWYVALVGLWPADSRPYIAGSTDNSLMQLALGYNGIQRIAGGGDHGGGPGGGHGPGGPGGNLFFGGEPGIGRMFGPSFGTEASWLLPAAIIGLLAGLWLTWRTARTGRVWASLLLWGGWLLVTGAVFSFMDGTVHPYYTVALAPAIAALVGIAVAELLRHRDTRSARLTLAVMLAATGGWAFALLDRTPDWWPALRWIVLVGSIVVAAALALRLHRPGRATVVVLAAAAL
ncbi:MAG TPA: glycosyltransferase family 39 protein, partial [Pseudonocardia sp.]|nr:glycosyltransferase family 39 protein [Pseudonocardia sp.]